MSNTTRIDEYAQSRAQAAEAFADHQMTVMHEDGVYRHLRFRRPDTWCYGFDLVTWPGFLYVGGDIESFTFSRATDMLEFFAGDTDINPQYWGEKVVTPQPALRRYDPDLVTPRVDQWITDCELDDADAIKAAWAEHVQCRDTTYEIGARGALNDFTFEGRRPFADAWEWDLSKWDHHFLLSCFAIKHGVAMWKAAQVS